MPNYSYDDLSEFLADAFKPVRNRANLKHVDDPLPSGFMCNDRPTLRTYEDARRALNNPLFPQGAERIERLMEAIQTPTPVSIKRRLIRDAEGDDLDVTRVWQGDLDRAWSHAKRQRTPATSRILIGVFVSASANVRSKTLAWRGAAALALANALEAASYMVEIRAIQRCDLTDNKKTPHDIDVTVKAAGMPLDLHAAANMLATPLLFRGLMFRHYLALSEHHIDGGFAMTRDNRRHDMPDRDVWDFVAVADSAIASAENAQTWINTQTAALDGANEA